jgi:hypothetical protein
MAITTASFQGFLYPKKPELTDRRGMALCVKPAREPCS